MRHLNQTKVIAWVLLAVGVLLMAGGVLRDDWRYAIGALIPLCGVAGVQSRVWPLLTCLLLAIGIVLIVEGAFRDEQLYVGALVPLSFVVWHCVNSRIAACRRVATAK